MLPISTLQRAPLLTRVLVTVAVLLTAFTIVVGAVSAAAVAATKAVFPAPEAEPLASATGAGETDGPLVPSASSKPSQRVQTGGSKATGRTADASGRGSSSKTAAKRAKGDSTE